MGDISLTHAFSRARTANLHHRKCPARFCSLDFGEHNGYVKDPVWFRSLKFGERNGYLKGVAPIDAQQKNMELRIFSCSRGSSWTGTLPAEVWSSWLEDILSNFMN